MDKPLFIAEVPTFALSNGDPDFEAVRRNVSRLAQSGYSHIAVAGLAGEYENLTLTDQLALIRCAAQAASDRSEIVAAAFDAGTEKAAARIAEHKSAGCRWHLCIASHFFGLAHPDELTRHVAALAKADAGLLLVDSPAHTGFAIPGDSMRMLCGIDGVAAVVDNTADPQRVSMLKACGTTLVREELVLLGCCGVHGVVSRLAVLFPNLMKRCDTLSESVREALLAILQSSAHPAAAVKYAAHILGLCSCPDLLPPASGLTAAQKQQIENAVSIAKAEEERLCHAE